MPETEIQKQWEGQVADGQFPLRRYLGGSDHSAVYLTELGDGKPQPAAIKFIPADPATAETQLARWALAAELSHPRLLRLLQAGRCELERVEVLYVVMEYAPEDLSQVLPERPLSSQEVREILEPALDALAYLHGQGFVQARLKPANFLAVDDRLKISADGVCPIGESRSAEGERTVYDSPEVSRGELSPASDVWSLGATLAEVLTQRPPVWNENEPVEPELPNGITEPFLTIVRHCLRRDPQRRWTIAEIATWLRNPAPIAQKSAAVPSNSSDNNAEQGRRWRRESKQPPAKWRVLAPTAAAGLALVAVLTAPKLFQQTPDATPPSVPSDQPGVQADSGEIVERVLPSVPQSASGTIRGTIRVGVRARVDSAGNVSQAILESPGPSRYFANLSLQAARRWKFTPAEAGGLRDWNLRFEYTQTTTKAFPSPAAP